MFTVQWKLPFPVVPAIFFELPITWTFFRLPLKVRVIGSRLYVLTTGYPIIYFFLRSLHLATRAFLFLPRWTRQKEPLLAGWVPSQISLNHRLSNHFFLSSLHLARRAFLLVPRPRRQNEALPAQGEFPWVYQTVKKKIHEIWIDFFSVLKFIFFGKIWNPDFKLIEVQISKANETIVNILNF